MLTQAQKKAWLEGLNNPAFKQTFVALAITYQKQTYYSALGVLAALMGYLGKRPNGEWDCDLALGQLAKLLDSETRAVVHEMNDAQKCSFGQIAAWIQKNVQPEFQP